MEKDIINGVQLIILTRKESSLCIYGKIMVYNIYLN
jgi:hypothetical protein